MPKVPQFKRCCYCCPLRPGIIVFGVINIICSLVAASFLAVTTETKRSFMDDSALEVVTSTVLFSLFGMGVILNIVLLVAGWQKDISMLRLYNYYAIAIILMAGVITIMMVSRNMVEDVTMALFAIAVQFYIVLLVRAEIMVLEEELKERGLPGIGEPGFHDAVEVEIPDEVALI